MAWSKGVAIDWDQVNPNGQRITLPGYAFQRKRCWIEPGTLSEARPEPNVQGTPTQASVDTVASVASAPSESSQQTQIESVVSGQLEVIRQQMELLKRSLS